MRTKETTETVVNIEQLREMAEQIKDGQILSVYFGKDEEEEDV